MTAGDAASLSVEGSAARLAVNDRRVIEALPTISALGGIAAIAEAAVAAVAAEAANAEAAATAFELADGDGGDDGDGDNDGRDGGGGGGADSGSDEINLDADGIAPGVLAPPPLGALPILPGPGPFPLGPTTIHDDELGNGAGVGMAAADDGKLHIISAAAESAAAAVLTPHRVLTPRHGDLLDGEPDSEPPSAYQSPTMSPSMMTENTRGYGMGASGTTAASASAAAAKVSIPTAAAEKMMVLWERRAAVAAAAAAAQGGGDGEGDGGAAAAVAGSNSSTGNNLALLRKVRSLRSPNRRGLAAAGLHSIQNRWRRVSNAVAGIVRAHKLVAADRSEFVCDNTSALMQAQTGELNVALEVRDARDLDKINYAHQGNRDMYSGDMINKRRGLRTHPQVMEAIRAWWRWLPKSATRVVVVMGGGGDEEDEVFAATLDEPIYSAMVVAVTMVLLPRFGLPVDEHYDPKEDWLDDNKGLPYMDFPNFFDALFELADMWSEGVGGPEYAELLRFLLRGVQDMERRQGKFGRLLKRFGHKPAKPTTQSSHGTPATTVRSVGTPTKPQAKAKIGGGGGGGGAPKSPRASNFGYTSSEASGSNSNSGTNDGSGTGGGGGGGHSYGNDRRRSDRPGDSPQSPQPSSPPRPTGGKAGRPSDTLRGKPDPRVSPPPPHTPALSSPSLPLALSSARSSSDDNLLSAWQSQRRLPPMGSGSIGGANGGGGNGGGADGGSEEPRPAQPRSSRSPAQMHDHDHVDYSNIPSTLAAYLRQPLPKLPPKGGGGGGGGASKVFDGRRASDSGGGGGGGSDPAPVAAATISKQVSDAGKAGDVGNGGGGGGGGSGSLYPPSPSLQSPVAAANSGAAGGGNIGGQQSSHIVFGGNWQLGEGFLAQAGVAAAAAAAVGSASGGGPGSGTSSNGNQALSLPNGFGGSGGPLTRRPNGANLRNAMSMDLPNDMPYGQLGSPGSLYAEYMDAVMSRRALRQQGTGGGSSGGANATGSPPVVVAGLAVLGAPPPLGPRSLQHAVLTVSAVGSGNNTQREFPSASSPDKAVAANDPWVNTTGGGAGQPTVPAKRPSRLALLNVTDDSVGGSEPPLGVQSPASTELPLGLSPQPREPPPPPPPQLPSLVMAGLNVEGVEEEDGWGEEAEPGWQQRQQQQQQHRQRAGDMGQERSILPSISTSSSDRADRGTQGRRDSPPSPGLPPPSSPSSWFSSPPPMPGPPRNTRHAFLCAAAPSTAPSMPATAPGAIPAPAALRATPSAGICLVEISGIGVSGRGSGDGGTATDGGTAATPPSPVTRGRCMGPAPILISVNSSPTLTTHSGAGSGSAGGVGFLPSSVGGSRSPGGAGSSGGDRPQALAALAAAAAAHLPTINHQSASISHDVGLGGGAHMHGSSPNRFHGQQQLPGGGGGGGGGSGSGGGGSSAVAALHGNASVQPPPRVSWGSSPGPGPGGIGGSSNGGGGGAAGGGVLLPHLSLDSKAGTYSSGANIGGNRSGIGAGGSGGRGFEMPPPPPPPPQARRDVVQASRAQVLSMAQALIAQQQAGSGGGAPGGGGGGSGSNGGSSRLESLRPLDGGLKRAQCGGSFLTYLQQGPHSGGSTAAPAAAAAGSGGGGGISSGRGHVAGAPRAAEPVAMASLTF